MLRDITIGQYYNAESFLHSLDPRTKLISLMVMMVMIFLVNSPVEYAFTVAFVIVCVILSRVPFMYILRGMKPVWLLIAFTAVINLFMGGGENVIVQWGVVKITRESLNLTIGMMLRVLLLITVSSLLTFTTSPMTLTTGIEKLLKPLGRVKFPYHEVAMMMSIALRFIPTLSDEAEKIMKAQASRGNDFDEGSFVKRAKGMIPLFIPLFISAFRRADDLAMAMESRCYNGGQNRTSFKVLKYKKCDMAAFLVLLAAVLFIVIYRLIGVLV